MPPQDWLRLVHSNETVSLALRVFARGSVRWSDLYHAFEIVQASVGGRIYDEGWITREQANLFSWTATALRLSASRRGTSTSGTRRRPIR